MCAVFAKDIQNMNTNSPIYFIEERQEYNLFEDYLIYLTDPWGKYDNYIYLLLDF